MKILKGIAVYISLVLALISCNDIKDCQLKDDTSGVVIALFDLDTTSVTERLDFTSITIENLERPLLNVETTLSAFALPVNKLDTTITYFFESDAGMDTMVLSYKSQYYIFFEECDPAQRFFDLKVISHTFDSTSVVNTELNNEIIRNVEVYLD